MAEVKTLKTRIALLYKDYEEWSTIKETYIPLKGEVCFCYVPENSHVATNEPTVMFKVGDGLLNTETGEVTGTQFKDLKWSSALAADVYQWAKKENLDFEDLNDTFKTKLKNYIESEIQIESVLYRLYSPESYVWKLQKSTDKGSTWEDAEGEVNLKAVVKRMDDLETSLTTRIKTVEDWLGNDGALTEQEVKETCPV